MALYSLLRVEFQTLLRVPICFKFHLVVYQDNSACPIRPFRILLHNTRYMPVLNVAEHLLARILIYFMVPDPQCSTDIFRQIRNIANHIIELL